jgi:hypothetical protein
LRLLAALASSSAALRGLSTVGRISDAAGGGGLGELGVGAGPGGKGERRDREQGNQVPHERLLVKPAAPAPEWAPV